MIVCLFWFGDVFVFLTLSELLIWIFRFAFLTGYVLNEAPLESRLGVIVYGAFADENSNTTNFLSIQVQLVHTQLTDDGTNTSIAYIENDNNIFKIPIIEDINYIDTAHEVKKTHTFYLDEKMFQEIPQNDTILRLRLSSNLPVSFPINLAYDPTPIDKSLGVIYAAIVLLGLYVMIIWEVVHRTFAAMVASTTAIAILALMNERPTMPELMSWIDVETLLLLFGMMILVAILSETGIFDYFAVYAFKVRFDLVSIENNNWRMSFKLMQLLN